MFLLLQYKNLIMKYLFSFCFILFMFSCNAQQRRGRIRQVNNNQTQAMDTTTLPRNNSSNISGSTQFGALIKPPFPGNNNAMNFKIAVARKLGLDCVRDAVNLDNPKDKPLFNSGLKVVLNVNNSASANVSQSPFPTDTAAYKTKLQYQLSLMAHKPVLLVIENEENNLQFHTGPAQDYLNELKAATTVAHANHIPVTNGGIAFPVMLYLVYIDYLDHGKTKEAADLQTRSPFPFNIKWIASRKEFLQQLIAGYAKSDIDYINFHWYGKNGDTKSLVEVVNYLQRVTGKPAITNEIGQHDNSPETVKAIIQTCRQLHLRYAMWYSGDGERKVNEQAIGLQNNDGSLRESGEAFKAGMQ